MFKLRRVLLGNQHRHHQMLRKTHVTDMLNDSIEQFKQFDACVQGPSHDGEQHFMDHSIFKMSREQLNRADTGCEYGDCEGGGGWVREDV